VTRDAFDKAAAKLGKVTQLRPARHGAGPRRGPNGAAEPEAGEWEAELVAAIDEMNRRYFVAAIGGRGVIGGLVLDDHFGRERLVFSRPQDVKLLYGHRRYRVGTGRGGGAIRKDLGTAWLEDPRRRTYDRIALIPRGPTPPGVFNLWRGFGVRPVAGGWPLLRAHLLEVICAGDEAHLDYLLDWCARCVQRPELQAEVAVVMRGAKGAGKGTFVQAMIEVFRDHALHITQARHLTGNFNAHLADALLLFVDEAFWAGDRQGEGTLKALVTEPSLMIEPKGVDPFMVPNRLKIMMASNNEWVVPASADERRYFVLDVSDARREDFAYFVTLQEALKASELAAFLDHLLGRDLSDFNIRAVPQTRALNRQKIRSLDSVAAFWLDCLREGAIIGTDSADWPERIATQLLHAAYLDHARDHGERHPATDVQMALRLAQLWEGCGVQRKRLPPPDLSGGKRPMGYLLDTLGAHREALSRALRLTRAELDLGDGEEPADA
jgi:Family of unknown function (DUF5906)